MFRYLKSMLSELLEGFDFYKYLNLINFIIDGRFFYSEQLRLALTALEPS